MYNNELELLSQFFILVTRSYSLDPVNKAFLGRHAGVGILPGAGIHLAADGISV
jgi:hypothetical protein